MAKATMKKPKYTLVLELTEQEAEVIFAMTGRVRGFGPTREATDAVFNALDQAGVGYRRDLFSDHITARGN